MLLFSCTLPFPPSVNALFGGGSDQKRFPSKAYKAWLAKCPKLEPRNISSQVLVMYELWLPDKRKRDLTNHVKAPEDFLVNSFVLADDNFEIVRSVVVNFIAIDKSNPRVEVSIFKA